MLDAPLLLLMSQDHVVLKLLEVCHTHCFVGFGHTLSIQVSLFFKDNVYSFDFFSPSCSVCFYQRMFKEVKIYMVVA